MSRLPVARWVIAALLLIAAVASAAERAPRPYTSRFWQLQDGLPESTVYALAQTRDGYLWIGTSGGLVRFDGVSFSVFVRDNTPALRDNRISALHATKDGSLWIGIEGGGLVQYRNGEWRAFQAADGLTNPFIRTIYEDTSGVLWVGTDTALFRREGARFVPVVLRPDRTSVLINTLFEDSRGRLWAAGTGIFVRTSPNDALRPADPALLELPIRSLAETRDGTLWAATVKGMLKLSRDATRFERDARLAVPTQSVYVDGGGRLWIGTMDHGLIEYNAGRVAYWTAPDAVPGNYIEAIFEDRERNLWLGTHNGLARWRPATVETLTPPPGEEQSIRTVYQDPTGPVWSVSSSGALYQARDHALVAAHLPAALAGVKLRTVYRDRRGALWIGTDGQGAVRIDGSTLTRYRYQVTNGLPNEFVRAFAEDRDGSMWVGTDGGLAHIVSSTRIDNFQPVHGLAYLSIRALRFDRHGVLWIGTDNGLSRRDANGFLQDAIVARLAGEKVWTVHEDANGGIWLGTRGGGVFWVHDGAVTQFTTRDGLASNAVFEILESNDGNLWMSCPTGVFAVNRAALERRQARNARPPSLTLFGISDGVETALSTGGVQPAGAVTKSGETWFATAHGVARFRSGLIGGDRLPAALIEDVIVDGRSAPKGVVALGPGNGRLEIRYAAVALRSPERIHFRYRMEGFDTQWSEAMDRRAAHYANLPPGRYVFRVQAYDVGAPSVVTEATVPIYWHAYIFERWWFLALCVASLAACAWWWHMARLRRARQRFAAVLEERKRLAREMHDTLIQSCVGVSTLLEAAGSMQTTAPGSVQALVDQAREQIRATIDEARRVVWNLRQRGDEQSSLAGELAQLVNSVSAASGIPMRFTTRGRAVAGAPDDNVLLVVREALANVVRHSGARNVTVELNYGLRSLEISVADDGRGFDRDAVAAQGGQHYGLTGMQERADELGGRFTVESRVGAGTTVRLRVPLARAMKKIEGEL